MMYNELVKTYFFNPKHVGILKLGLLQRCYKQVSSVKSYRFDLYLSIDEQGKINEACFKACGNPYLIAGLEYLCEQMETTMLAAHPCVTYQDLIAKLDIPREQYPIAILIEEGYRKVLASFNFGVDQND